MSKTKKPAVKPTTMRIPEPLLSRGARQAKRQERSRSYLFIKYIEAGLARDEKSAGALG